MAHSLLVAFLAVAGLCAGTATRAQGISTTKESAVEPVGSREPLLVHLSADAALAGRLASLIELWEDAGDFAVGRASSEEMAFLRARGARTLPLPALAPDEELVLLERAVAQAPEGAWPAGTRILYAQSGRVLLGVPAKRLADLDASLAGHGAHCGPRVIRRVPVMPAPPLAWRGRLGDLGLKALQQGDPRIQALVDQVDQANIGATIVSLAANFTRRADQPGALAAQNQLASWLTGIGYTPALLSFGSQYSKNVVATLPGALTPQKIVVLGAHYDSVNWQGSATSVAPGADDNASGSACLLELARILRSGGPYESTLRFIWFSGEELGLLGSDFAASQSQASGEQIVAMLNLDMAAYRQPGDTRDCDFTTNNSSATLTDFADAASALYVAGWASKKGVLTAGSSDHASYNAHGFPAAFFFEDLTEFYQQIHTANDVYDLSCTDFDLAQMIARGALATAATLAEPLDLSISHTPLADTQDGVGPYLVQAQVTSLTGAQVAGVELWYSGNGGAGWSSTSMSGGGPAYTGLLPSFGSPVTLSYYITATDTAGGSDVEPSGADLDGEPHSFFVGAKTVLLASGFEAAGDEGFTHGTSGGADDWQRGTPAGKAGDPASAWAGSKSWANDLGQSGFNGEYPANVYNWLRSPSIDCAAASNVHLEFRRWLGVEDGLYDQARIAVNGVIVWQNPSSPGGSNHTLDTGWSAVDLDVSAQAAGNPATRVEFRMHSDGGLQFGGWNIDDFELTSQLPAPPPGPPVFGLSPSSAQAVGGTTVVAAGSGMGGVASVSVGGQAVPFAQGAGEVSFVLPPATQLGTASVVVTTAAGSGSASLNVLPTLPYALVGPVSVALGTNLVVSSGGPPAGYAWLVFSTQLGGSALPGLTTLEIGGGNLLALYLLGAHALNAAGTWVATLPVPNAQSLSGVQLYLESLILDLGTSQFGSTQALPCLLQ